jgi:hypothetical protein
VREWSGFREEARDLKGRSADQGCSTLQVIYYRRIDDSSKQNQRRANTAIGIHSPCAVFQPHSNRANIQPLEMG